MFQFVFGWSSVRSGCLHWVEKIEYVVGECGWVKSFSCVLVNLMTRKDRSRGGASGVLCAFIVCALPCPAVIAWENRP